MLLSSSPSRKSALTVTPNVWKLRENSRGNKRGGYVKARFWRMCPRSGFWGPGISKIMASFCHGSNAEKDFWSKSPYRGVCQNHPCGNHPFNLRTSEESNVHQTVVAILFRIFQICAFRGVPRVSQRCRTRHTLVPPRCPKSESF